MGVRCDHPQDRSAVLRPTVPSTLQLPKASYYLAAFKGPKLNRSPIDKFRFLNLGNCIVPIPASKGQLLSHVGQPGDPAAILLEPRPLREVP